MSHTVEAAWPKIEKRNRRMQILSSESSASTQTNTLLAAALSYAARGWAVFPLQPRGKTPITAHGCRDATSDPKRIKQWWTRTPNANIGVATGGVSGIVAIDIDVDEARGKDGRKSFEAIAAGRDLPETLTSVTGRGGYHMIFDAGEEAIGNSTGTIGLDIDTRGDNGYIVAAPSIHENGHTYRWANDVEPAPLPDWLRPEHYRAKPQPTQQPVRSRLVMADDDHITRARAYLDAMPAAIQGAGGHNCLLAAATALVHGFELSETDALDLLWGDFNPRCSPQWDSSNPKERRDFERKVSQASKLSHTQPRGWLADAGSFSADDDEAIRHGGEIIAAILGGDSKTQKADHRVSENEPPLTPIVVATLPKIAANILPAWAGDYVRALAESAEVDQGMGTLIALAAIASTVQHCYQVETVATSRHTEVLVLMVAPAMESGERKTSTIKPLIAPLMEAEHELKSERADLMLEIATDRDMYAREIRALQSETACNPADRKKIIQEIVELKKKMPAEIGPRQLVVADFTEAALSTALKHNEESLLASSDEGGMFDNMAGRFSDTSEIDLVLKAANGSPFTSNRITRGITQLDRPLLSIAISPQPGILSRLGKHPEFLDRGLVARFLWLLPASRVGRRLLDGKAIPILVEQSYANTLKRMAVEGRRSSDLRTIRLSPAAARAWDDFQHVIEPRMAEGADLYCVKPWASKLAGAVARIAGVLHIADRFGNDLNPGDVTEDAMNRAIEVGHALIPHSIAVHELIGTQSKSIVRLVVDRFDKDGWPEGFRPASTWWRDVRDIVGKTSKDFEPIIATLIDHGYLIEDLEHVRKGRRFRASSRLRQE